MSGGGYEKAPRRREPIFLPALLLLLVSFYFYIYIYIYIILVSLFKSVVRFPELMVRNGGPEEIKKNIYKDKRQSIKNKVCKISAHW